MKIGGGGFIKKTDHQEFIKEIERQKKELEEKLNEEVFFKDAFTNELINHEYSITMEMEDALIALGTTKEKGYQIETKKKWIREIINDWKF